MSLSINPENSLLKVPSLSRRFFCMGYEAVLLFGVVFTAGYLFDTLTQSRSALMLRHVRSIYLFSMIGLYFTWFWTHRGQTLAMKTWRFSLVEADGRALSWPRAILRYVLCWMFILPTLAFIDSVGFHGHEMTASLLLILAFVVPPFWMKFDRDGQFIHDRILGTRLVSN